MQIKASDPHRRASKTAGAKQASSLSPLLIELSASFRLYNRRFYDKDGELIEARGHAAAVRRAIAGVERSPEFEQIDGRKQAVLHEESKAVG